MQSWTYEKAGVPHLKGDPDYNREIVKIIRSTHVPGVMGSATGFAALFDFKKSGIKNPLLVASTDGVGTKLEVARLQKKHDTIGIDLVAMCVNDLLCCGASPVFFLDYFAAGKFEPETVREVLQGIADGCRQAGCALIGGETAIMPGFYAGQSSELAAQYDVAGFSVGLVDRKKQIDGKSIQAGDVLLGLASTGVHSNGFSLIRRLFTEFELAGNVGRELLTPTRIYVKPVLNAARKFKIKGIINITGGGLVDNLPRVIPTTLSARIRLGSWKWPKIFEMIQSSGNIADFEMRKTFNLGIGMVLVLNPKDVRKVQRHFEKSRISSWVIGETVRRQTEPVLFEEAL